MDKADVAELLGFMALYDRRVTSQLDDEAWLLLPIMENISLTLAKEAVVLFHDQEPDPSGHSRYLDPQQFKRFVRLARARRERQEALDRARRALPSGTRSDPKPDDFDEIKAAANRARLAEMMGDSHGL